MQALQVVGAVCRALASLTFVSFPESTEQEELTARVASLGFPTFLHSRLLGLRLLRVPRPFHLSPLSFRFPLNLRLLRALPPLPAAHFHCTAQVVAAAAYLLMATGLTSTVWRVGALVHSVVDSEEAEVALGAAEALQSFDYRRLPWSFVVGVVASLGVVEATLSRIRSLSIGTVVPMAAAVAPSASTAFPTAPLRRSMICARLAF